MTAKLSPEDKFNLEKALEEIRGMEIIKIGDLPKIREKWNVNKTNLYNYMRKLGLMSKVVRSKFIEKFPHNDRILGYVCGFIAADGCLVQQFLKNRITITLSRKDIDFLNSFKYLILDNANEFNIREYTERGVELVNLNLKLPKLYQYCLDMGITPAKTYTLDVKLDDKSDEFRWSFLRGLVDGDGFVSVTSNITSGWTLGVCSSSLKLVKTLVKHFGGAYNVVDKSKTVGKIISGTVVRSSVDSYLWRISGWRAQDICNKLPKDNHCLTRKTELIDKLISISFENRRKNSVDLQIVFDGKMRDLSEIMVISSSKLKKRCVRWRLDQGWPIDLALFIPLKLAKKVNKAVINGWSLDEFRR